MFAQLQNSRKDQQRFPEWMEGIEIWGEGRIPALQVEGAAQGSLQGWKGRKNLPKIAFKIPISVSDCPGKAGTREGRIWGLFPGKKSRGCQRKELWSWNFSLLMQNLLPGPAALD